MTKQSIKKRIFFSLILYSITIIIITLINIASIKLFNAIPFAVRMDDGADCIEYIGPLMNVTRVCSTSPDLSSKLLLNIKYHPITLIITFLVLLPIYFEITMIIYNLRAKKEQEQRH